MMIFSKLLAVFLEKPPMSAKHSMAVVLCGIGRDEHRFTSEFNHFTEMLNDVFSIVYSIRYSIVHYGNRGRLCYEPATQGTTLLKRWISFVLNKERIRPGDILLAEDTR